MPSPASQRLTLIHRQRLARIGRAVTGRVAQRARTVDTADIDAWWSATSPEMMALVTRGAVLTADQAERYLAHHAALNGVSVNPVRTLPPDDQIRTSLQVTGPVLLKSAIGRRRAMSAAVALMAEGIRGAAWRLVLAGERLTVRETAWGLQRDAQVAGWRRVTGINPCYWCAMLASRGAVYHGNGKSAPQWSGHDSCRCTYQLLYEHEPEPPDVRRLSRLWGEVTAGTTDPVRAWREYWETGHAQ